MHLWWSFIAYLALFNLPQNKGIEVDNCFVTNNHFSHHLATATAYRFVSNNNDTVLRFNGCESKKIWVVIRHGSRYPSKKIITNMKNRLTLLSTDIIKNHKKQKGELCQSALVNISMWSPQVETSDNKRLVHEGEDEMIELAERFQNRFPDILPEDYSNLTYKFRHTATQRTEESKKYFTIGLFGRKVARYVWTPEPIYKDPVLRFYKLCSKWRTEVDKNPDSLNERIAFEESDHMKMTISNISRRLGFDEDLPLGDVHLMYKTCAFETAWNPRSISPWCNVFTRSDLEVMEYAEDLEYYWVDGYGYSINYLQACPIVGDMLNHLTSASEPKSTFYFTHSGTLLKMLAHLGLYKDKEKLTSQTFNMKRRWRVGVIDAFATNLAFVLYSCEDGLKVLTLHQERAILLPGCQDELCPLDTIISNYRDSFYDCDFSQICGVGS